jgi:hypothetical protein
MVLYLMSESKMFFLHKFVIRDFTLRTTRYRQNSYGQANWKDVERS